MKFKDLFKNKTVVFLIGIFGLVILIGLYLLKTPSKKIGASITAIPVNAAVIIETSHFDEILSNLKNENQAWTELKNIQTFKSLDKDITYLDSLFRKNATFRNLVSDRNLLISAHLQGKDKVEFLFILQTINSSDEKTITGLISEILKNNSKYEKRSYNNTNIFDVKYNTQNTKPDELSFCFINQLFIFSFSSILVENAVRQLENPSNLNTNTSFSKISQTVGKNVPANIYLNYQYFPKLFLEYFDDSQKRKISEICKYANWTAYDVQIKPDAILLNGFTITESTNFLNLFLDQKPQSLSFINIIPSKTAFFLHYGINEMKSFNEKHEQLLKHNDKYFDYSTYFSQIDKNYKLKPNEIISEIITNEIATVEVDFDYTGKNEFFIVAKTHDRAKAYRTLNKMIKQVCETDSLDFDKLCESYKYENHSEYRITKFPFTQLFGKMFGQGFNKFPCEYYSLINEYIVFAENKTALQKFIKAYELENTLNKNENFDKFSNFLSQKSNVFMFFAIPQVEGLATSMLNNYMDKRFEKYKNTIRKFQSVAVQFSSNNQLFYSNFALLYNPELNHKSYAVWEYPIDTLIRTKPVLVFNHNTNEKEIFVQDYSNQIYLISKTGKLLWKKQISEPIISDINQIDYYKNNKLQIMFNTVNNLWLIDRNGQNVEGYPIKLKNPAATGITIVDYENNRDYRIFLPCQNKKIYLLNKEGRTVDGWNFDKTKDIITSPVQYFKHQDKDYIVFSDKLQIYILNRKGENRIQPTENFPKSINSPFYFYQVPGKKDAYFITTDNSGTIFFISLNGTVMRKTFNDYTHNHFFIFSDINGDDIGEYIFQDKNTLEIFDIKDKKILSQKFENNLNISPSIYKFAKANIKIGITDSENNKIHLLNSDGTNYKGFPLNGNTAFTIGIMDNSKKFFLMVGNKDNLIYNFQLN